MMNSESGVIFSDELSFEEFKNKISDNPTLIIPVGGYEPLGENIPLGIINKVTESVAEAVAKKVNCLSAPLLNYGYSTPFSSFEGNFTIKRNIFESVLRNMIWDTLGWGVCKILIINFTTIPSDFFQRVIKSALKRGNIKSVEIFDFQNSKEIRYLVLEDKKDDIRLEKAILSLALSLGLLDNKNIESNNFNNKSQYSKWRRRGRDPELFKKLFPQGIVCSDIKNCSVEEGEDLLEKITSICIKLLAKEGSC